MMKLLQLGVASLATSVLERLRSVRLRLEQLVSQARKPLHPTASEAEPKAESRFTKTKTRRRRKRD
jgi:hypothetical protein